MANADASGVPVRITFSESAFAPAAPGTIALGAIPLPVVVRDDVSIDGSGRGVRLTGTKQSLTPSLHGLVMSGARSSVRGLEIRGFAGYCLYLTGPSSAAGGDPTAGEGNALDECETAIRLDGAGTAAWGNIIGMAPAPGESASVITGVWVTASNASVGEEPLAGGFENRIGNAVTGVRIGGAGLGPITNVRVHENRIGLSPVDAPAPVGTAVSVLAPASVVLISDNGVFNAVTGVSIEGSTSGPSAMRVTARGNTFSAISGLAIDLNADGQRNPNDPGDTDTGANGLRNAPEFTRAIQSRITGAACAGCQVEVYSAVHLPGGSFDFGSEPVVGGVTVSDAGGSFVIENPSVTPGQWLVALATDAEGNTSEFSASTRVGAGNVQCGNPSLTPGWNLTGYFGAEPVNLGGTFPSDGAGAGSIAAIYHLDAAGGAYARWLRGPAPGNTLAFLEPGQAYWMLADSSVALQGGFSLSVPVPVALQAGWNTVVYIGAAAHADDALLSIAGKYSQLYRWGGATQQWERHGDPGVPAWAQDFTDVQACAAYEVYMTEGALLMPLQP